MATFLTGGTGFLGSYLIRPMLEQGEEVVALVRGETSEEGLERLRQAVAFTNHGEALAPDARLSVYPGDLGLPDLGLSPEDRASVLSRCDRFLHCGATVRFDLPLEEARAINVGGTAGVLALASQRRELGGVERVDIVSTAYVAGKHSGLVSETEADGAAGHKNSYEQSKFEAEKLVWRAADHLPVCVLRPSIVVGESTTGRTPSFQGIYLPARFYARGLWRTLPARADCMIDLVPVDFVRDATLYLRRDPDTRGGCYHLAAGPDGDATLGELIELLEGFFPHRKPVRFVDPDWWQRWAQPLLRRFGFGRIAQVVDLFDAIYPYGMVNPRFDVTNTRDALAGSGIPLPNVRAYANILLEYGASTDWGRQLAG